MISLNLLPPAQKLEQKNQNFKHCAVRFTFILVIVELVIIVWACSFWLYLRVQAQALDLAWQKGQEFLAGFSLDLDVQTKALNQELELAEKLLPEIKPVPAVLELLSPVVKNGLYLKTWAWSSQNNKLTIYGFAPQREQVISLKEFLEGQPPVKDLQAPLSNFVKDKDINFSFSFVYEF